MAVWVVELCWNYVLLCRVECGMLRLACCEHVGGVQQEQEQQSQKAKWKFLQKYWHKGAFFQDDADDARGTANTYQIFARDFSAPTGEDNFDKSQLPAVMQVCVGGAVGRGGGRGCAQPSRRCSTAARDAVRAHAPAAWQCHFPLLHQGRRALSGPVWQSETPSLSGSNGTMWLVWLGCSSSHAGSACPYTSSGPHFLLSL
jgi:hypothetical protein